MFEMEFVLFPAKDEEYRACYLTDDLKIIFNMPFITDGFTDLIKCFNHEWLHALIDWGLEEDPIKGFKNCYDPTGESDHFIMRLINYD